MCRSSRLQPAINLLIAHDHALVRASLLSSLGSQPDVVIVGLAKGGSEAVRFARNTKPDVVLMDVRMPVCDGVNATAQILRLQPGCKILAFSFHGDEESVRGMLDAGAIGYLGKDARPAEVIQAILEVGAGRSYFSPGIHFKTPTAVLQSAHGASHRASPSWGRRRGLERHYREGSPSAIEYRMR